MDSNANTDAVILLVEDNADDEELTLRALKTSKVLNDVVVARDGEAALEFLFGAAFDSTPVARPLMPHIVLLDLKLPKIDGLEVLRRIRGHQETKYLPVIILTTSNEERDVVDSYDLGANSYVRKPVDFGQFVEAVKQLSLYWLVLNRCPQKGGV